MTLLRDLRYGVRMLVRNPGFGVAVLAVLPLGVGASTAIFSVLRGVILTPLPYREPNRLVLVRADLPGFNHEPLLTPLEYFALRDRSDLFDSVAMLNTSEANLTDPDVMAAATGASVTDNFFQTLGVGMLLGRPVGHRDVGTGPDGWINAVDLGYAVWQERYHGDPNIIGRTIGVNNRPVRVVGVLPREFRLYLGPGVALPARVDVWYPRLRGYDDDPARGTIVIAHLAGHLSTTAANAAVGAIAKGLVVDHPSTYPNGPLRLSIASLTDEVVSDVKPALFAIAGAVAFVLLVACANLMNLLLTRASARTKELTVRAAIGATRAQMIRQFATEGLLIGIVGGGVGLLLAAWGVALLLRFAPPALPRREAIQLDLAAASFAVVVSVLCALVVSLLPAWQLTRQDLAGRLKREADSTPRAKTTRGVLVAAQMALSLVLLVGAGLMTRAFISLRAVPLGFDPAGVVTLSVPLQNKGFNDAGIEQSRARRLAFYTRFAEAIRQLPGVQSAGMGMFAPLSGKGAIPQRYALGPADTPRQAAAVIALSGYLETLRVPLVAGRYFTSADDNQPVVIVDERLATELWPGRSALGQRLLMMFSVGEPHWDTVVGIARHVQNEELRHLGLPQLWVTYGTRSYTGLDLVVRAADPVGLVPAIKQTAQRLGTGRPVHDVRLLDDSVADASADMRFALFVLGVFAAVALLLTAVGVYGVVAYATARRTREIAVRLALGADARRIVTLVVREGAGWSLAGIGIGVAGSFVLSNYLRALLFHVGARDPLTFAVVATVLAFVSLAAIAVPAIRAVRVDPMLALRTE